MAFSLGKIFSSFESKVVPPPSVVGIDIGRSTIKVVELENAEEAPILKTYGEIQIGPYADQPIGASVESDNEVLTKSIIDVMREAGVQATHGVLSLPLSAGFATIIRITLRENEELSGRVLIEARKYVPLSLKEVTLDWAPIGGAQKNERGEIIQTILLVALPNEVILRFKSLLQQIELSDQPMELGIFSAARAVGVNQHKHTAVLDLGASITKLCVYQEGMAAVIHRFSAGGTNITEKLAELLSLDFAAAETHKRDHNLTSEQTADIKKVTAAILDGPLYEVRRILQTYETQNSATIDVVYLSGGVSNTVGIDTYIANVLQRPVERSFPFAQVAYPAFMEDILREIGPVFTNSLGAALRLLQ